MPYTYEDLLDAYCEIGLVGTRLVYVGAELWRLMAFEEQSEEAVCAAHLRALKEVMAHMNAHAPTSRDTIAYRIYQSVCSVRYSNMQLHHA